MRGDSRPTDSDGATADDDHRGAVDLSTRRAILSLTGAGLATAVAGCLGGAGPANTDNQVDAEATPKPSERPDITYRGRFKRVGLAPAVNDAGIELGAWRRQGLDVEYVTSSGAQAAAKSVASGKDTFGNGGMAAVLQLVESGAPLVVIGQIAGPMSGVVSLTETGITSWSDLEGKVVGLYPFGSTGPAAKTAMRKAGVDLSEVTFQNVQPGSALKLLLHGDIDAMIKYFPQMKERIEYEGREANALKVSDVLHHLDVALYTRREVVEDEPDLVDRFVRGWLNAFQLWANDVDEVIDLYAPLAAGEFNEDLERRTLGALYASQVPPKDVGLEHGKGWTPPEKLEHTIDVFEEAGLVEGDVSPGDVYTNQFIEQNHDLAVETAESLYEALERYDVGPNYV